MITILNEIITNNEMHLIPEKISASNYVAYLMKKADADRVLFDNVYSRNYEKDFPLEYLNDMLIAVDKSSRIGLIIFASIIPALPIIDYIGAIVKYRKYLKIKLAPGIKNTIYAVVFEGSSLEYLVQLLIDVRIDIQQMTSYYRYIFVQILRRIYNPDCTNYTCKYPNEIHDCKIKCHTCKTCISISTDMFENIKLFLDINMTGNNYIIPYLPSLFIDDYDYLIEYLANSYKSTQFFKMCETMLNYLKYDQKIVAEKIYSLVLNHERIKKHEINLISQALINYLEEHNSKSDVFVKHFNVYERQKTGVNILLTRVLQLISDDGIKSLLLQCSDEMRPIILKYGQT